MAPPSINGFTTDMASTDGHSLQGASSDDGHLAHFWNLYEDSKQHDHTKNVLIEDILSHYNHLITKHNAYVEEHQREREHMKQEIDREIQWHDRAMHLQRLLNRDPYILVLIDGDDIVFHDSFLNRGQTGGKQAATLLHDAVLEWAISEVPECPADVRVVIRIYADLGTHGPLATVCAGWGIGNLDTTALLSDFAAGFTRAKPLFDFIHVGHGMALGRAKITENFKLNINDYHCRQMLLGCSDNGYFDLLAQYGDDLEVRSRLTMLEGNPLQQELEALSFNVKSIPGLFRERKITLPVPRGPRGRVDSHTALSAAACNINPRTSTPNIASSPFEDGSGVIGLRKENNSPSSTSGSSTWATVTYKNAHKPLLNVQRPTMDAPLEPIRRNRKGQRLDHELEYEREEVQRLKKLKACNQHYIGIGCCHYNAGKWDKCPHSHHHKFTAAELKMLRVVARETPCKRGHSCDDIKCIYGHQCPFPPATEGSMRGIGCLNGDACRFPYSMHAMDTHPIKLLRVAGLF